MGRADLDFPGKTVSATVFVRNFGEYARTAAAEPIHILNHGRPAWTLVSTDYLSRVGRNGAGGKDDRVLACSMVLDALTTQVIFTDAELTVTGTNPAARHALGTTGEEAHGSPLARLMADARHALVLRAAERVRDTGIAESLDIDMQTVPLRTFKVRIEANGGGFVLLTDETTAATLVRERHVMADAYESMMDALPGFARGAINARGNLVSASTGLATLMTADPARMVNVRLSSLFHAADRVAVADAIDKVLSDRCVVTIQAALQAGGTDAVPVTLSVSPYAPHGHDNGAFFLIQRAC